MSEEFTLTLPSSTLEGLHCSVCQGYLSCSPVRILPNGNYICGRCTPVNAGIPIPLVPIEAMLSKMSFPCMFKKYGCPETVMFGGTADHECKCVYKPFACPVNTSENCLWEGSTSQLLQHFENDHPEALKDQAEFKLDLDETVQALFVVTENSFMFIVKYFYNANERILQYDVRFCPNRNDFEMFSKIQLINCSDADCSINLKRNECSPFDETFHNLQNAKVLNINKLLECLSYPNSIVVALKQKVIKSNTNVVTTANDCEVNARIKARRCNICKNYLVPPLFDLNGKTICCDCYPNNSNCEPSSDTNLLKQVNQAVYPCRWRECKIVVKSNVFKDHVMKCPFRQYSCVYSNCENTFKLSDAGSHFRYHAKWSGNTAYYNMPDEIKFILSFNLKYQEEWILTVKNSKIIAIKYKMINRDSSPVLSINLLTTKEVADIGGIVEIEHEHCKLKSEEFNLVLGTALILGLEDLPSCFKQTDELTVSVQIIA